MKRTVVLLFAAACLLAAQSERPKPKPDQDQVWANLFDGSSLSGWTPEGEAKWAVVEGAIICDSSGDGWLRTNEAYKDFVLHCDFRNSPEGNSGIFLRATKESKPGEPNPAGGYELQINNEDEKWATGSIEDMIQRLVSVSPAANQWHSYEVTVRGDHLVATLDGTKILDGKNSMFKSGYIGLQHHKNMKIEFRNLKIKDKRAAQ